MSRTHTTLAQALCGTTLAALLASPAAVLATRPPPGAAGGASVGHRDLELELETGRAAGRAALPVQPRWQRPDTLAAGGPGPIVSREVLGYLPYWEMDYQPPHWELLTTLAWFSVNMSASGSATDYNGWGGLETADLVAEAHANGVRVIVTVTNFDNDGIAALLSDEDARATAIETCLTLMAMHGADGVNIDFEFVPSSVKEEFVTFMSDLKLAVVAAQPNGGPGHVSLAGPAIDWNGAYDYDQLLINTDGIMVMAYGYHWKGGNPGPVSPLFAGDLWGKYTVAWTIDDYLTWGGIENRDRIIMGFPFYGRRWPVASTAIPGTALADGQAIVFANAEPEALAQGKQWDDASLTPYYHVSKSGTLWQVWYDDGASLYEKVAYVDAMDLGGIGIWALGYEGPYDDYWAAIADVLVPEEPDPVDPDPEQGPEPVPDPGPELMPEPMPEPLPELEPDPGPELMFEPDPEPVPEADDLDADTDAFEAFGFSEPDARADPAPDSGPPRITNTFFGVSASRDWPEPERGCAAGGGGAPAAGLLVLLLALVRLARPSLRSPRPPARRWGRTRAGAREVAAASGAPARAPKGRR